MKNIFDIKRFGQYFLYDLNNAKANFGVSAIVIGLIPIIFFFFQLLFSLLFGTEMDPEFNNLFVPVFSLAFITISAPIKIYGHLTERKNGSNWILVPATAMEKFISMLLIVCVVVPLVVSALSYFSDTLLYVLGLTSRESWISQFSSELSQEFFGNGSARTTFATRLLGYLILWTGILPFLLGSLVFKKQKGGKTFLSGMLVFIIMIALISIILKNIDSDVIREFFSDPDKAASRAQFVVNFIFNAFFFVVDGALLAAIYLRIKTLKF